MRLHSTGTTVRTAGRLAILVAAAGITAAACGSTSDTPPRYTAPPRPDHLVVPQSISTDKGLSPSRATLEVLRVRQLYTFWDTGDTQYLRAADSPDFVDHTLPAGRPQGLVGIEQASAVFRAAVPDLRCILADVLITGDQASVRQIYTGHFTGTYNGVKGEGQPVRFIAFDTQQIGQNQIVADWHLEDNLTFLQQIGIAPTH